MSGGGAPGRMLSLLPMRRLGYLNLHVVQLWFGWFGPRMCLIGHAGMSLREKIESLRAARYFSISNRHRM